MVKIVLAERAATEVAALPGLSRQRLVELWEQRFGIAPPKGCGRTLLELAAAYAVQEKASGALKVATRRALDRAANTAGASGSSHQRRRSDRNPSDTALRPGTRLVREWNGRTYHVEVVSEGFVWNGRTHRSLSAIAREITGAQWSGPRFFGL